MKVLILLTLSFTLARGAKQSPNIVFILADGIAFSQSYANQLCPPTRAAIPTGRVASHYWPQRDETVTPEAAGGPFFFRDLR